MPMAFIPLYHGVFTYTHTYIYMYIHVRIHNVHVSIIFSLDEKHTRTTRRKWGVFVSHPTYMKPFRLTYTMETLKLSLLTSCLVEFAKSPAVYVINYLGCVNYEN